MTTSILFQKRPLVVTVNRKLMLHQETILKYPQLKCLSHKIAVKCQNLLVTQVRKKPDLLILLLPISTSRGWGGGGGEGRVRVIVKTIKGGFSYRTF